MGQNLHILHTTPHARLQRLGMPPIQPHDGAPAHRRKDGPRVLRDALLPPLRHNHHPPHAIPPILRLLHRQLRQRQHHSGKNIDDDLLVHAALATAAEDGVAAQQAGQEGVVAAFAGFRGEVFVVQEEHAGFVEEGEGGEVAGVSASGFEDETDLVAGAVDVRSEYVCGLCGK